MILRYDRVCIEIPQGDPDPDAAGAQADEIAEIAARPAEEAGF